MGKITYQWKMEGLYKVDAQVAGEVLEDIQSKHGEISAKLVVDESRPQGAPLHGCFEWNDATAAEKYREVQAGNLIRSIVVKVGELNDAPIRAFVHVGSGYRDTETALSTEDMRYSLLDEARREMHWFVQKFRHLTELSDVIDSILAFENLDKTVSGDTAQSSVGAGAACM